jgi:hypothetical protein
MPQGGAMCGLGVSTDPFVSADPSFHQQLAYRVPPNNNCFKNNKLNKYKFAMAAGFGFDSTPYPTICTLLVQHSGCAQTG